MENEAYKIRTFLEGVAAAGAAKAIRTLQPAEDLLTQRKAYNFFSVDDARFGGKHGETWVKKQVAIGTVHPVRKGKAKNSPIYYSKAELLQAKLAEDAIKNNIFKDTIL